MKFTPEVLAAIQTLKNAAENDFERHRIAVLERDLTAPPKPEIVDENHQKFDGITYGTKSNGRYTKNLQFHRMIYTYYCGEIPEGYEIHHRDHNPANNDISNLQCITSGEHCTIHNLEGRKKQIVCLNCGKIFTLTKRAHQLFCSLECGNEYRAKNPNSDLYEERICEYCGKPFIALNHKNYTCCSKSCGSKLRWQKQREIQNKTKPPSHRICPICGKEFPVPVTNPKKICCSPECGYKNRKNRRLDKICPICHKIFYPKKNNQQTCSNSCANKLRWQKRKSSK